MVCVVCEGWTGWYVCGVRGGLGVCEGWTGWCVWCEG